MGTVMVRNRTESGGGGWEAFLRRPGDRGVARKKELARAGLDLLLACVPQKAAEGSWHQPG